jgi:DNA-binding transcriptional LysR family regulator
MELYQLRYFEAVANLEHVHRAARALHVSPPALSRAIAMLEHELSVPLFSRVGRRIAITPEGRLFAEHARRILASVDDAVASLSADAPVSVTIAGRELLLAKYGPRVVEPAKQRLITLFSSCSGDEAVARAREGKADLVVTVQKLPPDFRGRVMAELASCLVVGPSHPLYAAGIAKKAVPIEEVLEHPFACPERPLEGRAPSAGSADGWRDDLYPRKKRYLTESAHVIASLVAEGKCLAYLPSFVIDPTSGRLAKVHTPSSFECRWTVRLGLHRERNRDVASRLFAGLPR